MDCEHCLNLGGGCCSMAGVVGRGCATPCQIGLDWRLEVLCCPSKKEFQVVRQHAWERSVALVFRDSLVEYKVARPFDDRMNSFISSVARREE